MQKILATVVAGIMATYTMPAYVSNISDAEIEFTDFRTENVWIVEKPEREFAMHESVILLMNDCRTAEIYDDRIEQILPENPGDVNNDGIVDGRDVIRLMKYLAGDDVDISNADINADGVVDEKDLLKIMKEIV